MSSDDHGTASRFAASLTAGSRVAGYLLEERIGQGGMAIVFRARDERLGRQVALKVLSPALAGDEEFQRRFIRESREAAAIDDPHIVPVFAAGEADGLLYLAMRYVAGGDAHSLLKREGPLPPARVAAIISPMALALDAAHRAGSVHRDVKPSNMLMDVLPGRPDHVYLSDFGLSKAVASTSGITAAGMVMGTLDYMAPEQITGKQVDGRADQYALACSAFELLAGTPPFHRDEPTAVMYAQLSEPPPPLTSRQPGLPEAVDGVLATALAKAPDDRYASCGQFAEALCDALGVQPYRSGPVQPAGPAAGLRAAGEDARTLAYPGRSYSQAPATPVLTRSAPPTVTPPAQPGFPSIPPRRRNRGPVVAAIAVAVVVVLYVAVAAVAHTPPFTKSAPPLAGHSQSPAPHSPTVSPNATPGATLPPGVVPVAQLLPSDIDDPATQCQPHTPRFHVPGLTNSLTCIDPGLPGGNIFAYQSNGPANYQTAFLNFNIYSEFFVSSAGSACPPPGSSVQTQGTVPWHDRYFPSRAGQVLECQWSDNQPTYIWTFPTEDAFIVAVGATTFAALNSWWTKNQQPLSSPTPAAP